MQVTNFWFPQDNVDLAKESMNKEPNSSSIAEKSELNIPTDEEIFEAFTQGDVSALGVLYDRYGLLVYRLIYRMLNNSLEAEDLTQEIFLNLQVSSKFDSRRGSFYTYLVTLTRSRTIDRLRMKRSRGRFWQNRGKLKNFIEQQKPHSPMEIMSTEEISTQVRSALLFRR